jgi:hypothetical protein
MLQVFYLDIAHVLQWLQMCSPGVSYVCCKCFNCFGHMLQVFHLDITKVNLRVAHVTLRPIGSSRLLAPPTCAWVWRGFHYAGTGHEAVRATMQVRDTVQVQDMVWRGPH